MILVHRECVNFPDFRVLKADVHPQGFKNFDRCLGVLDAGFQFLPLFETRILLDFSFEGQGDLFSESAEANCATACLQVSVGEIKEKILERS